MISRETQVEVIETHRGHIRRLVRRMLRDPQHWAEGEQVGALGVIVALGKYDPDRGVPFWGFAVRVVENEIDKWMDCGVRWKARSKKGAEHVERDPSRRFGAQAGVALAPDELEGAIELAPNAEALVGEVEQSDRLTRFLATLSDKDRALLLVVTRERSEGGVAAGNNARSRRYLSLVGRAREFLRGNYGN
jgi:RNA polymerase sigma factor (sigma-70 family)